MFDNFKDMGVSESTLNSIVIIMALAFTLIVFTVFGLWIYDNVRGVNPPALVDASVGAILQFIIIQVTMHQVARQINSTAAKAATGAAEGLQPTMSQMTNLLAAAQPIAPQAPPVASSQMAEAMQENTQATEHNTEVMKETEGEHHHET